MAKELTPIEISNFPDVLRIVEEARTSKRGIVLTRDAEELAIVLPVAAKPTRRRRVVSDADRAAVLSAAGGWKGLVDVDEFMAEVRSARGSNRPDVEL